MKIAVSVETKQGLESAVAHHFGGSPYFAFVDVQGEDVSDVEVLANPYFDGHQPGQVPAFVHEQGADVILTGGMGARAIRFFDQFGIQTSTGATGTVQSAMDSYLKGELTGAAPCKESLEHGH